MRISFPVTINKGLELEFYTFKHKVVGVIADPTNPKEKTHVLIESVSEPLRVPCNINIVLNFIDDHQQSYNNLIDYKISLDKEVVKFEHEDLGSLIPDEAKLGRVNSVTGQRY